MGKPITRDTHPPATAGPVEELEGHEPPPEAQADELVDAEPARYSGPGEPLSGGADTE